MPYREVISKFRCDISRELCGTNQDAAHTTLKLGLGVAAAHTVPRIKSAKMVARISANREHLSEVWDDMRRKCFKVLEHVLCIFCDRLGKAQGMSAFCIFKRHFLIKSVNNILGSSLSSRANGFGRAPWHWDGISERHLCHVENVCFGTKRRHLW